MENDLVGIFRQEQDAKIEAPAFYLTRDEARTLKQLGQGFFINHGCDMRLIESVEVVAKIASDHEIQFRNSHQSRSINVNTSEAAIDKGGLRDRHEIAPFDFMRGRLRPLAVVAVESWAR
jgi:hypothetical protein